MSSASAHHDYRIASTMQLSTRRDAAGLARPMMTTIPAKCLKVSHIVYLLTICICFQTFFFIAYHLSTTKQQLRYDVSIDVEWEQAQANDSDRSPPVLKRYNLPRNVTRWLRVWDEQVKHFLVTYRKMCDSWTVVGATDNSTLCPCVPDGLLGQLNVTTNTPSWRSMTHAHSELLSGGEWRPSGCVARQRVAIVVPFRDRRHHLQLFLHHMHPMLQRQQLHYRIFVVEQAAPNVFNKAAIMNVGFKMARTLFAFDCIIFHDVDMLAEDDRNFYTCADKPRHVGAYIDKYQYRLVYPEVFGGATAFSVKHFEMINGFSNIFFGWGGEDDDMHRRVRSKGLKIVRFPPSVARYAMIKHDIDQRNPHNYFSSMYRIYHTQQYEHDGLNSLKYRVRKVQSRPLYTWIFASLNSKLNKFQAYRGGCERHTYWQAEVPLAECADACLAHAHCVAFVHSVDGCRLKNQPCAFTFVSEQYMYVKKTYKGLPPIHSNEKLQTSALERYSVLPGVCPSRPVATLDVVIEACAAECDDDSRCQSFMYLNVSDTAITSENATLDDEGASEAPPSEPLRRCVLLAEKCEEMVPDTRANTYMKGQGYALDHFRAQSGSCIGGDIEGLRVSRVVCALTCQALSECVGFVYVPDHSDTCWLKRTLCARRVAVRRATLYVKRAAFMKGPIRIVRNFLHLIHVQ